MQQNSDPSSVEVSPEAFEHSQQLQAMIAEEIAAHGEMPFDRFMELALYAPGFGYYAAGSHKFGAAGDFVTAPEISPLFSQCLANQCMQVLQQIPGDVGDILEFGAGSGIMAAHILRYLAEQQQLPNHYYILDLSPDLKARQAATLARVVPDLVDRVVWLNELPSNFSGVILANEVLDAMPVSLFKKEAKGVSELKVSFDGERFLQSWQPASSLLSEAVEQLESRFGQFDEGYVSEINLRLQGWLSSLSDCLTQGVLLLIDYGYSGFEYYHPDRHMGTLICHYQHRAHDDPFKLIGLQDITANVDFSAVKQSAEKCELKLAGYTPQANFLMATGIEALMQRDFSPQDRESLQLAQAVKVLMLPTEMGERFKVIALSKNFGLPLMGFQMRDFRDRL